MTSSRQVTHRVFRALLVPALLLPATARGQDSLIRVTDDPARGQFVIFIGPVDLPAGMEHHGGEHGAVLPPVRTVSLPRAAYVYGFDFDVIDGEGKPVPSQVIHHLNFIDPDRRELFLPISQRVAAAGGETGKQAMPWFFLGLPVTAGQRIVVSAMLHNPTGREYRGAMVRFRLRYVKAGRPWPLLGIQPFQVDVAFPFGDKSWNLPPGVSSRYWEGKPAVPGRMLAMGGHLHEHATSLEFKDMTTGAVLWEGRPYTDDRGNVNRLVTRLYLTSLGVRLDPAHTYRVTVNYLNPTPDTIPSGGMGVVGGVFLPADGASWPATDSNDFVYTMDRKHYLREAKGTYDQILAQLKQPAKTRVTSADGAEQHHH